MVNVDSLAVSPSPVEKLLHPRSEYCSQPNTQVRVKYLRLRDLSNVPRPQTSMLYQEIDQVENTPTQGQTIGNHNEPLSVGGYPWEARALNKTHKSCCIQSTRATTIVPFGVTYEKIGTIQRRLAWPLHKDDTLSRSGRPTGLNIYFLVSRGLRIRPERCTHSCIGTHEVRLSTLERLSLLDTSQ
ncbi:hypothetical protein BDN71DRAFT_335994 [Pleurotus eryngii]|uniref:Uncharacterized protein n=1 Tax=Pleurotus eryngii TaxID=5323 RepID=A0A9P6D1V0_PLEER|nr:hypothetical protein BDN71DRAFT_335994 [Pleurotus eryngii]